MDLFMELTTEMDLLTQQLRLRKKANEHHQRVKNQVWLPYASMEVPYI